MPQVKCHVNTCTHWMSGMCGASNIDILNESAGDQSENDEQTECKTFYRREGLSSYVDSMDNVNWGGMTSSLVGGGMSPSVTCVVESCAYWGSDDLCQADDIEVTGSHAQHCQDTNCRTFRQKK